MFARLDKSSSWVACCLPACLPASIVLSHDRKREKENPFVCCFISEPTTCIRPLEALIIICCSFQTAHELSRVELRVEREYFNKSPFPPFLKVFNEQLNECRKIIIGLFLFLCFFFFYSLSRNGIHLRPHVGCCDPFSVEGLF